MGNMIALDSTLFIQLVNFLVTIVVLNFLLIKPVRQQIAARGALTSGYLSDIEKFNANAATRIASYERSLAEARDRAALAREALKAEGRSREQDMLLDAQTKAQTFLQTSRKQTAADADKAMKALRSQVNAYAARAADKILA